jgi:sugar phosphate isomerase/epimerase
MDWPARLGIMCLLTATEEASRQTLAAAAQAGFHRIQVNFPWNRVDAAYLKTLPGWIRAEGLRCDVLGAYVNCASPDMVMMATRREDFARALDYAGELEARRLTAWTGSFSAELMKADPRNAAPAGAEGIVRFLDPWLPKLESARLTLALETYITLVCPDADSLRKLLDRLSPRVGAVLDPPNLTPIARYAERDAVLREMILTLRGRVAVVHMKDFRLAQGDRYDLPGPLMGAMNYPLFLRNVAALPGDVPLIAEHLQPPQFAEARRQLLALASSSRGE